MLLRVLLLLCAYGFLGSQACLASDKYTIPLSQKICPCWWDLEGVLKDPSTGQPYKCACCKNQGVQCGYPLHEKCVKSSYADKGCVGSWWNKVNNYRYTLSEIGHPCHWDPSNRNCAWCTNDGYQCAQDNGVPSSSFKPGQYCEYWKSNFKKCGGESQDCRLRPNICHKDATCVSTGETIDRCKNNQKNCWHFHRCACNPGFVGNGIFCADASGDLSNVLVPSSGVATVNLTAELRKEKVFGPTANPVIDIGLVSDLQEVLGKLEADANCLNSEMCQVNKMACGPQ